MFAKCTAFEAATHAPMMIAVPGLTDAGHISTALTEHVDLMPTLCAAAGIPVPPLCPPEILGRPGVDPQPLVCTEMCCGAIWR